MNGCAGVVECHRGAAGDVVCRKLDVYETEDVARNSHIAFVVSSRYVLALTWQDEECLLEATHMGHAGVEATSMRNRDHRYHSDKPKSILQLY